jgi:hypothetical protein
VSKEGKAKSFEKFSVQSGKKSTSKGEAKESAEINSVEKKLSAFHWDNRKDAWKASQNLARPHPS